MGGLLTGDVGDVGEPGVDVPGKPLVGVPVVPVPPGPFRFVPPPVIPAEPSKSSVGS